ncbi:NAD(P)/FAD-dependent oxidoreductase [Streptomyces sp. NPDC126514]|uniref:protoporphyrinogen/coproporphyrinogen oxidase n=1 Tax=Streptomyces sp. NPDC126514 TaxID=3155210 RepID=UPI0033349C0D
MSVNEQAPGMPSSPAAPAKRAGLPDWAPRTAGPRVVVVGAGIAGLTAAFRLHEAGCQVTVLERDTVAGGRMRTTIIDGYRIDTAASILSTCYTDLRRLIKDAGLTSLVSPACDLFAFTRGDQVHRVRTSKITDFARTRLLSPRAKLRLAGVALDMLRHRGKLDWTDPSQAADLDTQNMRAYLNRRRIPPEVLDLLVEPLSAGFCLASPDELSVVNLFFFLYMLGGNGLINTTTGIQTLCDKLTARLDIRLSADVTRVATSGQGATITWNGPDGREQAEQADAAVIATPAPVTLKLHTALPPYQRHYLRSLVYRRGISVFLGLNKVPAEPAMFLSTASRHPGLVGVVLEHNKAPGRAPAGHALLAPYWRHRWHDEHHGADDTTIAAHAVEALAPLFPEVTDHLDLTHIQRWDPHSIVWTPGSLKAHRGFRASLDPASPIQLAGDYFSFECTNSSAASGARAAQNILHCR